MDSSSKPMSWCRKENAFHSPLPLPETQIGDLDRYIKEYIYRIYKNISVVLTFPSSVLPPKGSVSFWLCVSKDVMGWAECWQVAEPVSLAQRN